MNRRVVITGMGAITPLANGVDQTWSRLIEGQSGVRLITSFDVSDLPVKIGASLPRGEQAGEFHPDAYMSAKEQRRVDDFILYAYAAAIQAIEDADWKPTDEESLERTGVIIGSGIGGLAEIDQTSQTLKDAGPRRVSPFFVPAALINLSSGHVSMKYGFRGPNHSVVTACATGTHAIGDAARLIQYGDADVMVAGSSEAALCRLGVAGFAAARALSTKYNDRPHEASRPWDQDRDGFVIGEGAGVMVLEEREHAMRRGARIYAEVVGYGLSGDAHHVTAPPPDGAGAYRAMKSALRNAALSPESLDYINAHGTSTPPGDAAEALAVARILGDHRSNVSMSSTKSAIGHLLGAAGSVEAIFCVKALQDQIVPPTLNLHNPSPDLPDFDFVPHRAKERSVEYAMSNSFGFGGTNASLILKRA